MLETKPGQAVSIIECDMNVSFYSPKERGHEIMISLATMEDCSVELVDQYCLC